MKNNIITPEQKSLINEFMSLNIEAKQFAVVMSQKYDYYYDNNDCYDYADVKLFDALLFQRNTPIRNFIDEVCKARMDIMSSDRECAAFIAAIHYFVYENRPDNDTTPAVELPAASEFMADTFKHVGNVDKTKYMCVVIIGQCWPNAPQLRFVYHGNRRAAKEYFANMLEATIEGRPERRSYDYESIYCMVDNFTGEKYAMTIKDEQKTEQTRRWLASQKAISAAFPQMPLQLPAITESAIYEAAAHIRANYEAMKAEQQQPAANTLPAWLFVGAEVMTKGCYMLDNKLRRVWVDGEKMTVDGIKEDWVSLSKRDENGLIVCSQSMKIEKAIESLTPADEEKQPEATVEQPAPLSVKKAHTPRNQKCDMLQDWGEKIGGARKDEAQPHNNNGATITAPAKALKYGLTCRDKINEEGEKVTRWYLKISPTRYSLSVYIDMPFVDISADIFRLGDESTEKAEKAFIEKYPNFDNYYKFDIFQIGFNKEYIVEAKRVKIRVATFDNLKAARDYMNTDRPAADLEAAKAGRDPQTVKRAAALVVRNSINRPRIGTDYTQGRNITPEELATRFGLRAVEFGNWMNADDRQTSINECFNSFRALAELLGVPDEKIGRGTLAIAFGARGTGKANAHYEPARHVINLTRTRGAGSLAHEWAHSIDSADGQRHHLSKGFYFGGFSYRSKQAGSYWGSEHEQFARAFETAVHYALKDREVVDDYLVNIIEDCPVYPTWVENERIAPYVIEKIKDAL